MSAANLPWGEDADSCAWLGALWLTDIWYKSSALAIVVGGRVEDGGGGHARYGKAVAVVAISPVFWHGCFARNDYTRRCLYDVVRRACFANACLCVGRVAWRLDHMCVAGLGALVATHRQRRVGPYTMCIIAEDIVAIWR